MESIDSGLFYMVFIFILIFGSGFGLSRTGAPYNTLLLTPHKLIGLGAGIFLVLNVLRIQRETPLSPIGILAVGASVLFFLALVVTGGLVSVEKPMPLAVSLTHKLVPYFAVVSSILTMVLAAQGA